MGQAMSWWVGRRIPHTQGVLKPATTEAISCLHQLIKV